MQSTVLGIVRTKYKETGKPLYVVTMTTYQIQPDKGEGYNVSQFFVSPEVCPDVTKLHCGLVEVALDDWNNRQIKTIKNI